MVGLYVSWLCREDDRVEFLRKLTYFDVRLIEYTHRGGLHCLSILCVGSELSLRHNRTPSLTSVNHQMAARTVRTFLASIE